MLARRGGEQVGVEVGSKGTGAYHEKMYSKISIYLKKILLQNKKIIEIDILLLPTYL